MVQQQDGEGENTSGRDIAARSKGADPTSARVSAWGVQGFGEVVASATVKSKRHRISESGL